MKRFWNWIFDCDQGGELGQIIRQQAIRQQIQFRQKLIKPVKTALIGSRDRRRLLVVLIIALVSVMLQESNTDLQESGKNNIVVKIIRGVFSDLESISLASAGIIFLIETRERRQQDFNELWQIIHSASGQSVSRARMQALEELNRYGTSLEGIDLSGANLSKINFNSAMLMTAVFENAQLSEANLENAKLQEANLKQSDLGRANLKGAFLRMADMRDAKLFFTECQGTDLGGANLQGIKAEMAQLQDANLRGAHLEGANLKGASLSNSYLAEACLKEANLTWANLQDADLRDANLQDACLSQANLRGTDLRGANLQGANLQWVKNLTQSQVIESKLCHHTKLPDSMSLKPNYNCREQGD